jgi:hypothetical protein
MARRMNRFEVQSGYVKTLIKRLTGEVDGIKINHDLGNFVPSDVVEISNVNGGKRVPSEKTEVAASSNAGSRLLTFA